MKRLILIFVVSSVLGLVSGQVRYFPQIADGVSGGGGFRFNTSIVLVNTGDETDVRVEFLDDDGAPLPMEMDPWGEGATFDLTLRPGEATLAVSAGEEFRIGYGRLTAPESVGGTAIFSGTDIASGVILFEAGVPAVVPSSRFNIFVDSLGERNTGLALVAAEAGAGVGGALQQSDSVTVRLYDSGHQLLGTSELELFGGRKISRFVDEFFIGQPAVVAQAREMLGVLEVEAAGSALAAVTLRQLQVSEAFPARVPTLTTFPVVPVAVAAEPEWDLLWSDEFEGDSLNPDIWEHQTGRGSPVGWGNNELQFYTSRPENTQVSNGTLKIIALKESYQGAGYTSARIRTKGKRDWKYSRIEVRARMPKGQGIWPAIWMMPTDDVYGTWAASGEIDIVELVGHEPDTIHGTIHYGAGWPNNQHSGMAYRLPAGKFSDAFHVFTLEWEEGEIRWYVDGELYVRQNSWHTNGRYNDTPYPFPAPFDQRFHMLINLAVGGNWPKPPDETTVFPQTLEVDYVRVYQRAE